MKGVSPLIASVLLIAITMAVAAILASWVSSYTTSTISRLPTCTGGRVDYVTADYPKWSNGQVIAGLQATYIDLGKFVFEIQYANNTISSFSDTQGLKLASGATGTAISPVVASAITDVKQVRIGTNCSDIKTEWLALK